MAAPRVDRNSGSVINDFCRNGVDNVTEICENNNNASEMREGPNVLQAMVEGFCLIWFVRLETLECWALSRWEGGRRAVVRGLKQTS